MKNSSLLSVVHDRLALLCFPGVQSHNYLAVTKTLCLASTNRSTLLKGLTNTISQVRALVPLDWVVIDDDLPFEVQPWLTLRKAYCDSHELLPALGTTDAIAVMEQQQQIAEWCEVLLSQLPKECSVFKISMDGQYLSAYFSEAADPPEPATTMVGKSLTEVLGSSAAQAILAAVRRGDDRVWYHATINGETRHYEANIAHCPGYFALFVRRQVKHRTVDRSNPK